MNKLPLFFLLFCMLAVPACKDFDAIVETEDALATARADHKQGMEYDMALQEARGENRSLYQRICKLMEEDEIFTDPSANHETLARILGTNVTYIYDALRECAGITPADLLTCSEEPVGLIIEMSGITNRSTFNRLFREYYSMSPTEYRQAARTV